MRTLIDLFRRLAAASREPGRRVVLLAGLALLLGGLAFGTAMPGVHPDDVAPTPTDPPAPTAAWGETRAPAPIPTHPPTRTPTPTVALTGRVGPDEQPASASRDQPPRPPAVRSATPTPNPLAPYTIPALAVRAFGEGDILVSEVLESDGPFHRYVIEYPSDGITVTGLMNVPYGEGPFPVVIVLHGYIAPEEYERGLDTLPTADALAWSGYAAIMPDYRGYMGTAGGPDPLRIPYAIDALNLIESLDTLDVLDEERVGVIGHSMGGGVATYVMVLSERVDAVVLYGAMSADQAANWTYISGQWAPYWMALTAQTYGSPESNPEGYAQVSPIHYLDRVRAPVQIHHGVEDDQVPLAWSRELAGRLRKAGAEVALYEYEGAGHTFYGEHLTLFLERVYAFFEEHVREG